jgi:hypothetical protein
VDRYLQTVRDDELHAVIMITKARLARGGVFGEPSRQNN